MKKQTKSIFASLMVFAGLSLMTSCSKTPDDPIKVLDPATGTVQISFLNYPGTGDVTTTAAPGDYISVAVQVLKSSGGNKPQKLRVYETNVENTRGTQVGSTIDLRNTSDAQVKNVNYTVPVGTTSTKYLYFEVDESSNAFSRKLLKITNTSIEGVNSYEGIVLGAQVNTILASRLASSTGQLYKACDAAESINDIDITYASVGAGPTPSFIANPFRIDASVGLTNTTATNCDDSGGSRSTAGGPATIFALAPVGTIFATANDASLGTLLVSGTSQKISFQNGDLIAFKRTDGKKGLIKINSFPAGTGTAGSVSFDLKVQR